MRLDDKESRSAPKDGNESDDEDADTDDDEDNNDEKEVQDGVDRRIQKGNHGDDYQKQGKGERFDLSNFDIDSLNDSKSHGVARYRDARLLSRSLRGIVTRIVSTTSKQFSKAYTRWSRQFLNSKSTHTSLERRYITFRGHILSKLSQKLFCDLTSKARQDDINRKWARYLPSRPQSLS